MSVFQPDSRTQAALQRFVTLLMEANQVMNLTACKSGAELWERHVLDSLTLLPHLPQGASVADIGSGGGFPALPLAIVRADLRITMIEATGKKCGFLQSVVDDLNLRNARVVNLRSEIAAHERDHREAYNFCTARAVSAMRVLLELALPFVKVGGSLLAMKGANVQAELLEVKTALARLGGGRPVVHPCPDSANGACIVQVPKIAPTHRAFPRAPGKPASEPL